MDTEVKIRTATEVLISLENKVDQLMHLHRSLDLNIKVISNKLNQLMQRPSASEVFAPPDDFGFEQYDPAAMAVAPPSFQGNGFKMKIQDELPIPKELQASIETEPVGFRRTSRPETYAPNVPIQKSTPTPSIQQPEMKPAMVVNKPKELNSRDRVPIQQRVVDKNGKSVFMASVEIINADSNITEVKTKSSGTGKWQASLTPGNYRVIIQKYESLTKQNLETTQRITIDENTQNELPMIILKDNK